MIHARPNSFLLIFIAAAITTTRAKSRMVDDDDDNDNDNDNDDDDDDDDDNNETIVADLILSHAALQELEDFLKKNASLHNSTTSSSSSAANSSMERTSFTGVQLTNGDTRNAQILLDKYYGDDDNCSGCHHAFSHDGSSSFRTMTESTRSSATTGSSGRKAIDIPFRFNGIGG